MSDSLPEVRRDGTSQAMRHQAALDPDYVSVDERSLQDLLRFARAYAKELKYYDEDDREAGDWSAFLGPDLDLDEMVAFMEDPEAIAEDKRKHFTRPHLVLFLAFLHLLRHAQSELNTLTGRHLDFYYRQVLRLTTKPAVPDHVNLLLTPAAGVEQALLPAGSLLMAGLDVAGRERVYRTDRAVLVNRAQIARLSAVYTDERLTREPVAGKKSLRNLYPSDDVTSVTGGPSTEVDRDVSRWKTFGQRPQKADRNTPPAEALGWAIASPLLALSEGDRQIVLTLGFASEPDDGAKIEPTFSQFAQQDSGPFRPEVSTARGWMEPDRIPVIRSGSYQQLIDDSADQEPLQGLQFTLTFSANADPIAPPTPEHGQVDPDRPVLRLMLRQIWQADERQFVTLYDPFSRLKLARIRLQVRVGGDVGPAGLTTLLLQNDETTLVANKPFEPFGSSPAVGSRFYLGHPELVQKEIESLGFNIAWMGVPANLSSHYAGYGLEADFKIRISLIDKQVDVPLAENAALFAKPDATARHRIEVAAATAFSPQPSAPYRYQAASDLQEDEPSTWGRHLQWELTPLDFQHQAYPAVAAQKALELAVAIAGGAGASIEASAYGVKPPYTPKAKSLSLDYAASHDLILQDGGPGLAIHQVIHIHPFGWSEVSPEPGEQGVRFLPQYDHEGELYIGLRDVSPPQSLAVLFQMAEGSADPDLERAPIAWSCLSGDHWLSLDGRISLDTTRGLINSGIIEFALEPCRPSTRMSTGLYWLRAAVARNSGSVGDVVAIRAQATSATFVDIDNAAEHYRHPLPAESITALVEPLAEIAAVEQPYTSFGGKLEEQDAALRTRASERLRHKQRALTSWDYERLVLEHFSQIYKAKCLPADQPDKVGKVAIIVIPDIRHQLPFNPFEPKAPANLIADIQAYLADKTPASADVEVRNAHYVPVKVRLGVRFWPGHDEAFYKQLLNEELNRFLSPWAYEEAADIVIGGRIYANSIVNFVDRRDYVDYVATISLFSSEDGHSFDAVPPAGAEGYFVTTKQPDGVLVAARRHEIDVIGDEGYQEDNFAGVGYMKIELDLVIA